MPAGRASNQKTAFGTIHTALDARRLAFAPSRVHKEPPIGASWHARRGAVLLLRGLGSIGS